MAMDIYQHDSPEKFRIVLKGDLGEAGVLQLLWVWETAKSTLKGRQLILEVSDVGAVDPAGLELLSHMREAGACVSAARTPNCEELIGCLDLATPTARTARRRPWALWKFLFSA
jgi:ABC-type transporter Mla MlaB component